MLRATALEALSERYHAFQRDRGFDLDEASALSRAAAATTSCRSCPGTRGRPPPHTP